MKPANLFLFPANGKRKFGFLGRQMTDGYPCLMRQQTYPYMLIEAITFLPSVKTIYKNIT